MHKFIPIVAFSSYASDMLKGNFSTMLHWLPKIWIQVGARGVHPPFISITWIFMRFMWKQPRRFCLWLIQEKNTYETRQKFLDMHDKTLTRKECQRSLIIAIWHSHYFCAATFLFGTICGALIWPIQAWWLGGKKGLFD